MNKKNKDVQIKKFSNLDEHEELLDESARTIYIWYQASIEGKNPNEIKQKIKKIEQNGDDSVANFLLLEEGKDYFDEIRKMKYFKQIHTFDFDYCFGEIEKSEYGNYNLDVIIYYNIEFTKKITDSIRKKVLKSLGIH